MTTLLSWRVWVALAIAITLAASHYKAYHSGGKAVQADWDAQTLAMTQAALAADIAARAKEADLQTKVKKVSADYAKQKQVSADLAKSLDDSLRDFNAALGSVSPKDSTTTTGNHGTGGLERELLGNCAAALGELAGVADRLEGKVVALQGYVGGVCQSKPISD